MSEIIKFGHDLTQNMFGLHSADASGRGSALKPGFVQQSPSPLLSLVGCRFRINRACCCAVYSRQQKALDHHAEVIPEPLPPML